MPPAVLWKNIGFIVRTVPFARRLARRHLEEAAWRAREADLPGVVARSLLDLGMLDGTARRFDDARRRFEEAYRLAEGHSPALSEKIREALASLP